MAVNLISPLYLRGGHLSKNEVTKTHKVVSLHVHVERAIGCVKQYYILSSVVPLSIAPYANHIWYICCALVVDVDKLSDADI